MEESRKDKLERAREIFNEEFIETFSDGLTKIVDPASGKHFSIEEARSLIISLVGAIVDDTSSDGLDVIIEQKMCEFGLIEDSESSSVVRIATTQQFYALAKDSVGRNRGPNKQLLKSLDLSGVHVLSFQMLHNDVEWRGMWLCKMTGSQDAAHVWMDNGMAAYEQHTSLEDLVD